MKRLTDQQLKNQAIGRQRIREAAKDARDVLTPYIRFHSLRRSVFKVLPITLYTIKGNPYGIQVENDLRDIYQYNPHPTQNI